MPTIGYTTPGTAGWYNGANECLAPYLSADIYTAVVGDQVDYFYFWGWDAGNDPACYVELALYDRTGNFPVNRIHAPVLVYPFGGTKKWWQSSLQAINLVAGIVYCVGFCMIAFPGVYYDLLANNCSRTVAPTLPAVWNHDRSYAYRFSVYANVINVGGARNEDHRRGYRPTS